MLERHTFYVVEYPISQSYISWKNNCSNSYRNLHSFKNNNVDILIPKTFRKLNNHIHYKKALFWLQLKRYAQTHDKIFIGTMLMHD